LDYINVDKVYILENGKKIEEWNIELVNKIKENWFV
jgi:Fe-S cluster assembly ATPase SufC